MQTSRNRWQTFACGGAHEATRRADKLMRPNLDQLLGLPLSTILRCRHKLHLARVRKLVIDRCIDDSIAGRFLNYHLHLAARDLMLR